MTEKRLVLGYFANRDNASEALKTLRRNHFWRAVLVHRAESGRVIVEENTFSDPGGALLGCLAGFVVGRLVPVPRAGQWIGAAAGAAAGFAAARKLDLGIKNDVLERYQKWVLRGETMVMVESATSDVDAVVRLICSDKESQPTLFIVRSGQIRQRSVSGDPLRSDVFTADKLREHAIRLANAHTTIDSAGTRGALLNRLRDNEEIIAAVNRSLNEAVRLEQPISIAAEWLLDNAYVVEGQIADVRANLSKKFYEELPLLDMPDGPAVPRIYDIACELILHIDGRLDRNNFHEFVTAYQSVTPLTMGELWALPLAMRLTLIENLRRLTVQVDRRQRERERADFWANRLLNASRHDPDRLLLLLGDLAQEQVQLKPHFADRLVSHLYDEEAALVPVQSWLENKLNAPLSEIIQREQHRQAADQVSVANTITSLRFLTQIDWRECFEALSHVEAVLKKDPVAVYAQMDFATRDLYRHEVERVAHGSQDSEVEVARRAVSMAQDAVALQESNRAQLAVPASGTAPSYNAHIGFYLVDDGRTGLEASVVYAPTLRQRGLDFMRRHPEEVYFGALAGFSVGAWVAAMKLCRRLGAGTPLVVASAAALPAMEIAMLAVNYLAARLLPPRQLPKMNFEEGIPDDCRTLVVVPMLLMSAAAIEEEIERLEVHFLANPDSNFRFALLADFHDSSSPRAEDDAELLETARSGIERLNERHRTQVQQGDAPGYMLEPFYLFHRERAWSDSEQRWMGWERKRGKLEQLNKLLLGQKPDRPDQLQVVCGREELLCNIRYVITVDADTQIPHDSARRMVETLAHPLNRPLLGNGKSGSSLVRRGYSIIQPRVSTSLPSATATRFSRVFTDPTGTDPYTHAVSDLYQDLFNEGSYHGKGIYDLAAFDRVLGGRFPDATLLSHDLIEGAHARVGLATDIELFDQFPPTYSAYCKREHRWIRGDWQIAQWVLPGVPKCDGGWAPNPLSLLNRWKIADNLRRSLMAPAIMLFLTAGWLHSPAAAAAVTILVVARQFFPTLSRMTTFAMSRWGTVQLSRQEIGYELARSGAETVFLPHQAILSLDAIIRALYRRIFSRRLTLEWEPAAVSYRSAKHRERTFLWLLCGGSAIATAIGIAIFSFNPTGLVAAAPLLAAWCGTPVLAAWLSGGVSRQAEPKLADADVRLIRSLARQTWRYFDDFVGPQTHWLPPDNYQETLNIEIAQRTSPTNIGLYLLAVLAAYDFGYVSIDEVIGRCLSTMTSIAKLEHYGGHLLNWYDVGSLEPLRPRYVSTVDSGNLIVSLWTLIQGCLEVLEQPLMGPEVILGLQDALHLLQNGLGGDVDISSLRDPISELTALFAHLDDSPLGLIRQLRAAVPLASALASALSVHELHFKPGPRARANLQVATTDPRIVISGPSYWAAHIVQQLDSWILNIDRYLGWMELLARPTDDALMTLDVEAIELRKTILREAPSLDQLGRGEVPALDRLLDFRRSTQSVPEELADWLRALAESFGRSRWLAGEMLAATEELIVRMRKTCDSTDMRFLYNADRKLFSIGFNADEMRLDQSYYDLLASECRLASLMSIARGQVPVEHWLALGRRFSITNGRPLLLSWSGTMFEYLMPVIFAENFENSLLDLACKNAVARQIEYGNGLGIPWGVSESAFSALDVHRIYQYKAFGVPGLGLKRGLQTDKVVAPYASAMALMIDPQSAIANLKRLESIGARGEYGFYDAVDFARQRLSEEEAASPTTETGAIVRTFMVHHQGMSLLSFDNVLHQGIMQRRFQSDPFVRAVLPLLYEKIPSSPPTLDEALPERSQRQLKVDANVGVPLERFVSPDTTVPRVHLFSNGGYAVMVTNAGGGYSRWRDMDVTRWRADTTRDNWGSWLYLRDPELGIQWSMSHQPLRRAARMATVVFKADRALFQRRDSEIETLTEVTVSPEDDAEVRRVTLINQSPRQRTVEVTSYLELAMASHNADAAHPAFSKLFVQTEAIPDHNALLAWRRPRSPGDAPIWTAHLVACSQPSETFEFETDRARFVGRAHSCENPVALDTKLSNTAGPVLDPIFSLRRRVVLKPGQRVELAFVTMAAASRDELLHLVEKYAELPATQRVFDLAWTHSQLEMHHLRIQAADGQRFQHLASHMLYPSMAMRAPARRLRQNRLPQSGLWAHGISGDLPIMVVTIDNSRDLPVVRQALLAHTFWRVRGLKTDLVILNEQAQGYEQSLTDQLRTLIQAHSHYTGIDTPGGIFLRGADGMPLDDRTLLLAVARVVLVAARGALAQQLSSTPDGAPPLPGRLAITQKPDEEPSPPLPFMDLPYFNGLGGFTPDGREYAVYLGPQARTPAPWINVMANPQFGCLFSESTAGFSWFGNSQSNRITPWSNDAVSDPPSDVVYLRDEDTGALWSATPLPIRELDAYRIRHGQGYTLVEHNSHAIEQELLTFVPLDDSGGAPVRVQRLRLRNNSSRRRRLRVTAFIEWALGVNREDSQTHIVTSWDAEQHILLARNAYNPDFGGRMAFLSSSPEPRSFSGDRAEFLGRNGSVTFPAAMRRRHLAERCGPGYDPCGAVQVLVDIEQGKEMEIVFVLGEAASVEECRELVQKFRDPQQVQQVYDGTRGWWDNFLGGLQVEVPDVSANFLLNRWLPYQTLSCRIWGRSAFYQSGGAYGFRDQLQDVMAMLYAAPQLAREQILRASGHQFVEGDVQHWWHPPSDAGVRTRFADDLLWLPYVTARYVAVTGDRSVLDEMVHFIETRLLEPSEHEVYLVPQHSQQQATVFEHCRRAIEKGSTAGQHGLPLIGTGDWNDGMNRVGCEGKGESVWMAWFLIDVLHAFADICGGREDQRETALATTYRERAAAIAAATEASAWDGEWYKRAYFDDGTPLGSHENEEAKIDSIAQSWGVISGAAPEDHAARAMKSVERLLVREQDKMILLFTPPFDKSAHDPGYIKGYLPGVRENGGQYTHAAIWTAMAVARRGDGDRAVELLRMLNPVEHTREPADVQLYKVEPYVVAADIYALPGRVGQGGWTWYTGSSSWYYRVWIEEILGFKLRGDLFTIEPTLPRGWAGCKLSYRYRSAQYRIAIENPDGVNRGVVKVELDGIAVPDKIITLQDDGTEHTVRVVLGKPSSVRREPRVLKEPKQEKNGTAPKLPAETA